MGSGNIASSTISTAGLQISSQPVLYRAILPISASIGETAVAANTNELADAA